jgi:hypothetical protein
LSWLPTAELEPSSLVSSALPQESSSFTYVGPFLAWPWPERAYTTNPLPPHVLGGGGMSIAACSSAMVGMDTLLNTAVHIGGR